MTGYILAGVAALTAFYVISIYNRLVAGRNSVASAWSDITVQLKRRHDLIPNLVETVKGYAGHEKSTLDAVIRARNAAASPHAAAEQGQAENMLSGALKQLFALSEAYPDLKANSNFRDLQEELSALEDTIQAARRFYNGTVQMFNNLAQSFPSNLVANGFGFNIAEFFTLDEAEQARVEAAPEVRF